MNIIRLNTAVVGSGAAGYAAALRLISLGIEVETVGLITEGVTMGTSRNTGSDKQTYYKLSLAGDIPDSVADMARDLFAGGCVDGDNALAEAAFSARAFSTLCDLGVPFPTNRYGEYVGYKTDHDPRARATSVGPLTSKYMTEALETAVLRAGITIYDHTRIIALIKHQERVCGLLGVHPTEGTLTLFHCKNVIYATGGPAGMYADSVYPVCHSGGSGVAFEAGVVGQNLTEWQYGLASLSPRWNVSGTYMQVLPRFVSVDADGVEHEFLRDAFATEEEALDRVFLKGYQWPFDSRKVSGGSSDIDLLVYCERVLKGRRVYLDYRSNPFGHDIRWERLAPETRDYLARGGATFGTPIERLAHLNAPAVALYADKGVDLCHDMLEISLCAQHNNGGLAVDLWWQTNLEGFFAVGEAAGTHGITRPGGSALNAGQVGAIRAAAYIAANRRGMPEEDEATFLSLARPFVEQHTALMDAWIDPRSGTDPNICIARAQTRMSNAGGAIRTVDGLARALDYARSELAALPTAVKIPNRSHMGDAYRLRDMLICQITYLSAMLDYAQTAHTRGSALYPDPDGEVSAGPNGIFRFTPDRGAENGLVRQTHYTPAGCMTTIRPVRPLPEGGGFFETVWREFRTGEYTRS